MKRRKNAYRILLLLAVLTGAALLTMRPEGEAPEDGIVVAGGNTTERQILAEITAQMIRRHLPGVRVELLNNLGSTVLIRRALDNGDVNLSGAMYTGTSLTGELGLPMTTDPREALDIVVREYERRYREKWYPSWGFANTYAFMVPRELAEREGLRTVSDLARIAPGMKLGVDTAWMERKGDGYRDFRRIYGFDFKRVFPMEIGLVYGAVRAGEMDVVLGYSTDGRIDTCDLVLLEDDRRLFPPYDASPVAAHRVLEAHPQLDSALMRLAGTVDGPRMRRMNRMADEELVEPRNVARLFLEEHGYFESSDARPEPPERKEMRGWSF